MRYEPITPEILKKLQAAVGPKNVTTDPDKMQPYSHDEVTDPAYHHMPEAVVFAETDQPERHPERFPGCDLGHRVFTARRLECQFPGCRIDTLP